MCDTLGLPTEINEMESEKTWTEDYVEDRVILETEITLESGPAITMQIHEESRPNSVLAISESEEDSRYVFVCVYVYAVKNTINV